MPKASSSWRWVSKLNVFKETKLLNFLCQQVDVDLCEDIAMDYNISSMPTFVFLKNGAKVEEFAGANASRLEDVIKANI